MRVLIMNDHPFIRRGVVSLLEEQPSCEWIVEATNFSMGSELIVKEMIDIVIVDVTLGEKSGFEFIRQARKINTECKFIVFTASLKYQEFSEAQRLEVDGYILKNVLPEEFLHALQIIKRGRKYYDPDVIELKNHGVNDTHFVNQLTAKELEVLIELGKGNNNKVIAENLYISEYTVKKHVSQILSKLDLPDRTQAALYANAMGIVTYAVQ